MRGVSRSFWLLFTTVLVTEVAVSVLAARSVSRDLSCWLDTNASQHLVTNCGWSSASVGYATWLPAVLILTLFAASVVAALLTASAQVVRTRRALHRLPSPAQNTERLQRIEVELGVLVSLIPDDRRFCCCAGLVSPKILISSGMLEGLDDAQLRAVLSHEARHVQRHDPARAMGVRVAANALFFMPLARHLAQTSLVAAELGADASAVAIAGRGALVGALLRVLGEARPVLGGATEMASLNSLDVRIEALRNSSLPSMRPSVLTAAISAAVLAVLLWGAALLPSTAPTVIVRHTPSSQQIAHTPTLPAVEHQTHPA